MIIPFYAVTVVFYVERGIFSTGSLAKDPVENEKAKKSPLIFSG
jgi:hypothetical protein